MAIPSPSGPVRWTAVLTLGLPLIVLNGGWVAECDIKSGVTNPTISTLFMGVLFLLFVLTLLNAAVRRSRPRAALTQAELMALYTLLSLSSAVAGVGHFAYFTPFLVNPFWLGTPGNGWQTFLYLLPPVIGPRDPAILRGFYEGHASFFRPDVVRAWAGPLLFWGIFFFLLLWTTLCVSVLLRRRWTDDEHLPFPVIALPLEMTRTDAPLYRQKLLWCGFALPAASHSLNTLQNLIPTLPTFPINTVHDLMDQLHFPWTGVDFLPYLLHGAGVGFGYLINTDVSFSLWFFYLLKKALNVVGVAAGWRDPSQGWLGDSASQFPFTSAQGWGAWLAFSVGILWGARDYLKGSLHRALRGDPDGVDRDEPMSARVAVGGLLLGFVGLCACIRVWGGSWWLPAAFFALYLLLMTSLSRLRAETAVLSTDLGWVNPQSILPAVTGTVGLSHSDLTHMGMLSWFNTDYRAAAMPQELEGLVGQSRAGGSLRPMVWAMLLAGIVAVFSALLWDVGLYYVNGAGTASVNAWPVTGKGAEPWNDIAKWLRSPKSSDGVALTGMAVGAGVTLLLTALRARFFAFPLHPAAYVLNVSYANDVFWCDLFVAWLVKTLILRYGGIRLYRSALPFFLGLILGDFVTGAAWSLVGIAWHVDLFRTFAI